MRDSLSLSQIFRVAWELEALMARDFITTLKTSNVDIALEDFDRNENTADSERAFMHLKMTLDTARAMLAEREMDKKNKKQVEESQNERLEK